MTRPMTTWIIHHLKYDNKHQSMDFFNIFLNNDDSKYKQSTIKQFGFEIDYFSRIYGRMIMVGHVVYKADKNYRSKKQFEDFRHDNNISIPAVVLLFEEPNHIISNVESIDNMFINKTDEIREKYFNDAIILFGYIKRPKVRKNGKVGKPFKVYRRKRFIIPITDLLYRDDDMSLNYCNTTTIHCTFRQKLT